MTLQKPYILNKLDTIDSSLADIVQVSIKKYSSYVSNGDWSPAINQAILENYNAQIYIPAGTYNFSQTIQLGAYNSLYLAKGSIIKATASMNYFVYKPNTITGDRLDVYTDSNWGWVDHPQNYIGGHGIIDCNLLANYGIALGNYRLMFVDGVSIFNPLIAGINAKYTAGTNAVELMCSNLRIENTYHTNLNTTGIIANCGDSHFDNIIFTNMDTGINNSGGGNKFNRCHPWITHTERLVNSIGFYDTNNGQYDTCYADTTGIGFSVTNGARIVNCSFYNSPTYPFASGNIGIKVINTTTYKLIIANCMFAGAANSSLKAYDGDSTSLTMFSNNYGNSYVTSLPDQYTIRNTMYFNVAPIINQPDATAAGISLPINAYSSGKSAYLKLTTANSTRWQFGKNEGAESGSNAGSNLVLSRFADNGGWLGDPISVNRSTGNVTINDGNCKVAGTYLKPFYMGTYAMWIDGSGKLRIYNGTPSADSDGVLVGSQS